MPKIVNHEERKRQIAEAAWNVIRRDGMEGASVRRVAEEAGISLGALRHDFDSQQELLAYAMRLISERVNARISKLAFSGEPRRDIELVIAELLPLDEERLNEAEVWLAFAGKAISDETVRAILRGVHEELYAGFRNMIDRLIAHGRTRVGIDAEYEARRLHAFIDGLVVHHATFPERLPRDELARTVAYYLDGLFVDGATSGR